MRRGGFLALLTAGGSRQSNRIRRCLPVLYLDAPRELDDAEAAGALETARRVCEQVRVAVALGGEP